MLLEQDPVQVLNVLRTVQELSSSPFHKILPLNHNVTQFLYTVGGALLIIILNTFQYFMLCHHQILLFFPYIIPHVVHTLAAVVTTVAVFFVLRQKK